MSELFTQINEPIATNHDTITTQSPQHEAISDSDKKLADTFQRINKQETHLKSERVKIEEARKAFESEKEKAERYKSLEGKSPFEILEHFGITYDKLLEADKERHNPIDPAVRKALEKVEQLESKLNTKDEEATRERRTRAEIQMKADIAKTIKEHEFDVIETMNAESVVVEYMEEIYSQTGEIPDYKEACQAVTDNIVEQYHKLSKSKWVKPKEESIKESIPEIIPKTLANKMTQSNDTKPKILNEAERMKAALQALHAMR